MTQATRYVAAHRVDDVAFSPDGKSVAIMSSGVVGGIFHGSALQLFDVDSATARWKHSHYRNDFTEVTFTADGSLLSVGGSGKPTILDAGDGHVVMRGGFSSDNQSSTKTRACISPDGTWLITFLGRRGRVYEVGSGAETFRFGLTAGYPGVVRYSPDGTRIAMLGGDGIDVWDAASFQRQVARPRLWSRPRTGDGPMPSCKTCRRIRTGCSSVAAATCW